MNNSNNEISVRYVNEVDIVRNRDNIIYLLNKNYQNNFSDIKNLDKISIENYENMKLYLSKSMAIVIGAFQTNKIIGFLWAYERNFLDEKRYHLGHIIIDDKYRKKGIGRKLINELEFCAENNSISTIELMSTLKNTSAMRFYENLGFNIERVQLYKKIGAKYDNKQNV